METIKDGDFCLVISGTHIGKSAFAKDIKVSKTGYTTSTVVQKGGQRFKTLARNVQLLANIDE